MGERLRLTWRRAVLRGRYLTCRADPTPAEFASAATALLWGLFLACPAETFASPQYADFARLAPEWAWAAFMAALGAVQLWSVFTRTARRRVSIWLVNFVGLVVWTWIGITAVFTWPPSAVGTVYLVLAAGCWWAFLRSGPCTIRRSWRAPWQNHP